MSKTVAQIFAINPVTTILNNDLIYLVNSPYTPGTDAAITGANLKSLFASSTLPSADIFVGNAGNVATAVALSGDGTLANTGALTISKIGGIAISLAGSFTTSGAFAVTQTYTGITNVTFPTSGTLATTSQLLVSPLTTKGDLWVWSTTNDRQPVAVGDGKILQVSSGAATGLAYSTPTYPSASGTSRKILVSDGTNNIYSTETYAVPGTSGNVLTSDGTNWTSAPPAVTTVLTTKGDILGFSTVDARIPVGTTDGQILQVNSANAVGVGYSIPTYPSASGGAGTILRSDGTNNLYTTTTYPNTNAINTIMFASSANVLGVIAAVNGGVLVSNNTGVPSMLANPAAVGKILQSANAAIPAWSTPTFPTGSGASGAVLISDGTNYVASTSLWPNTVGTSGKVVISNGTSNVYSTPTFPNASATTRKIIVSDGTNWVASTETYAVPGTANNVMLSDGTNWTSAALPAVSLPAGTMFNLQSANTTTVSTTTSASFANISGVTVAITPTSSSNKILVRAVLQVSATSTAAGFFQLARGGSAIGVGAAAGSRTVCGAASIGLSGTASMQTVVMEFLDSPATTSATTYTAQWAADGGVGTISINASNTDTNTSSFPRTSSTISVCEVHA